MTPNPATLVAFVFLLFPTGYFLLASPAFLLVKLDIVPVTELLRGLFNAHFVMLAGAAIVGAIAFAASGRPVFAVGLGLLAAAAIWTRPRFLQRWDAQLSARDAGDAHAVGRLRRLHWTGMLCNAVLVVAIVGSISYVGATTA